MNQALNLSTRLETVRSIPIRLTHTGTCASLNSRNTSIMNCQSSGALVHQNNACDANKSGPHSPACLLGLPSHLRMKILRLTGLARPCHVDLAQESKRLMKRNERALSPCSRLIAADMRGSCSTTDPFLLEVHSDTVCVHAGFPVGILRVCKTLGRDATSVLYGENKFYLLSEPKTLSHLFRFSTSVMKAIRRLSIRVCQGDYYFYLDTQGRYVWRCIPQERTHQHAIEMWHQLYEFLASSLEPATVHCRIRFDVQRVLQLRSAFEVSRKSSVQFQSLSMRFAQLEWGSCLSEKARRTIENFGRQSVSQRSTLPAFPLPQLPRELQEQIFHHVLFLNGSAEKRMLLDRFIAKVGNGPLCSPIPIAPVTSSQRSFWPNPQQDWSYNRLCCWCCSDLSQHRRMQDWNFTTRWSSESTLFNPSHSLFQISRSWRETVIGMCRRELEFVMREPRESLAALRRLRASGIWPLRTLALDLDALQWRTECVTEWSQVLEFVTSEVNSRSTQLNLVTPRMMLSDREFACENDCLWHVEVGEWKRYILQAVQDVTEENININLIRFERDPWETQITCKAAWGL